MGLQIGNYHKNFISKIILILSNNINVLKYNWFGKIRPTTFGLQAKK